MEPLGPAREPVACAEGMETPVDVLIFAEDPGAANYVSRLPDALERRGHPTRFLATGFAGPYLHERGVEAEVLPPSITAEKLFDECSPGLLVTGTSENPDTLAFGLIAEARSRHTMSVGAVDAYGNAGYRFRGRTKDPLRHAPDRLAVADQWTKEAYMALGYPEGRIAVCGHPHYDYVLETAARLEAEGRRQRRSVMFPHAPEGTPVAVFAAEVSTGLNPSQYRLSADYTLRGRGERKDRTSIVLEEFLDAVDLVRPKPYLVLRMHPKNLMEELAPFLDVFDQVSRNEPALELVYASDLVVGMSSMLLMEATIMGRPTLSIVPKKIEGAYLPTIKAGITPHVTTREDLRRILPELLHESKTLPVPPSFVQYGSLERTVAFIESLLPANE